MTKKFSLMLLAIVSINGCSNIDHSELLTSIAIGSAPTSEQLAARGALSEIYQDWNGVPYRWGGNSKQGIDCSAFTQVVMMELDNTLLPRTTNEQSKAGYQVGYQQAQTGDLVFFKMSRKQKHVGVYLGEKQFMHASTSKGVIISRLDNPYWADVFWHFRRVN